MQQLLTAATHRLKDILNSLVSKPLRLATTAHNGTGDYPVADSNKKN